MRKQTMSKTGWTARNLRPSGYDIFAHQRDQSFLPAVDRISSAVHRGVSRDGRFVDGGARNQEPDGDIRRRDSDLDRFGPSD